MKFNINDKEKRKIDNFIKNHKCKYRDPDTGYTDAGAIGGATTYKFTPTSLGVAVVVSCCCGEEENVTDYGSW